MKLASRSSIHSTIYFALLILLVIGIPTSNFLMGMAQTLLAVNWIAEFQWKEKFNRAKKHPVLWAFLALFFVHVIWSFISSNWCYALDDLRKKLPLLAIPLIMLTSSPLSKKKIDTIFIIYIGTLIFVSLYSWINRFINPDVPYRSLFPYISHIRLALNACLSIFILLTFANRLKNNTMLTQTRRLLYESFCLLLVLWFLGYLFLLQSYTGFIILFISFAVVGFYQVRNGSKWVKLTIVVGFCLLVVSISSVVVYYTFQYYNLKEFSTKPLESNTINGNPYIHRNDGFIEYGNYVYNYICLEELNREWNRLSDMTLDSITPNGYPIEPTLIRYLNSKGLTKDSVGVSQLKEYDVVAIESGKPTIYEAISRILPQMMYRILFEYENYRVYKNVKDFSMLQRFEMWKNASQIIADNIIMGVGTGDVNDAIRENLTKNNSQLKDSNIRTHNQYLTFLLTFGVVGTFIIVFFFVYAVRKEKLLSSPLIVAFLCIFLVSFISEDTLETAAGCLFTTFFFALFVVKKRVDIGH